MTFEDIFFYILILLGILPIIFYFKAGSKKISYINFLLPYLVVISIGGLYEIVGTEILKIGSKNWFRIYVLLEFCSLLYFYSKLLERKKLFVFFGGLFVLMYLYQLYEWICYPAIGYNLISLEIIRTLLILVSSVIWFVDAFKKLEENYLHKNPVFYIIASFLLCYCSTFIVFIVTDYMKQYKMNIRGFYMIVYYANLVLRGTLTIVCWNANKNLSK